MAKRKIIKIDEAKCNGCGQCIPNCPEGAIQIVDNKARLISDLFCDGLGACIGYCPQAAITIEEREAEKYDECRVMENIVKQGKNTIIAHHAHGHAECPGAKVMEFKKEEPFTAHAPVAGAQESQLGQWPIQLMLVPVFVPFLDNADILIAADCVPFAYANFHQDLLKGKVLLVGCPKFDDIGLYTQKITQIIEHNNIKSITYAHMEVPCCFGLMPVIQQAISASGKIVSFCDVIISIKGDRLK
ncbi:MAG: 4Fe-4S binding protein [Candidatus Omnitrophica bacterium]|nr:4Fe-4S binding protein [Candidatus Omnitrophota bacterium]